MNNKLNIEIKNKPELDTDFIPFIAYKEAYEKSLEKHGSKPFAIAIERNEGYMSVHRMKIHSSAEYMDMDKLYVERLVKFLLWMKGGYRIYICGDEDIADYIKAEYSSAGGREFDALFMARVYENDFSVEYLEYDRTPAENENGYTTAGKLNGNRIGFDAGGSDMKVCAVKDGEVLYSDEIVWHPKINSDPNYHYENIAMAIAKAAEYLDRVDAIGISSAGIYVNNRCMVASLFLKVPQEEFDSRIKDIYLNITGNYPDANVKVLNDGDVASVAGAMNLEENSVLGIAMGTSEAAGYVDNNGQILGWLNELAFAPVDLNLGGAVDEWSGDYGCGVKYFSQDSVIKLALNAGIKFEENSSPAQKLKHVQNLLNEGSAAAQQVFRSIGMYLAHTLPFYYEMYSMKNVLLMGRVMSGEGGNIIIQTAKDVIADEYPETAGKVSVQLPDEKSRRVGQSIAAAGILNVE